jgi:tRNA 2-thiouridine synthesizing protein E
VIEYLRDVWFNHNGEQPNNRAILKAMQEKWQAGKVAGLPESMRKGGY